MDLEETIVEQKKALEAWYEGFLSGDIEHAYSRFDDDCTWSGIDKDFGRVEYKGKQAIINYQSTWVHTVWTGTMKYFPIHTIADGNALMAEWEDEATSRETGEVYRNRGVFVFEFDGGTTVKRGRAWFDSGPLNSADKIEKFAQQGVKTE
jgi:ketosteroid isomerase-like protein